MKDISLFQDSLRDLIASNGYADTKIFSKAVKIDETSIGRWLNGKNLPSIAHAIKLADFFNCSCDYLFGLNDQFGYTNGSRSETFMERFDTLKLEKELTDYQIAKACRLEPSVIAKWRKHNRLPHTDKVLKLAEFFECSLDYLIGRSDHA